MDKNLQLAIEASLRAGEGIMEIYDKGFDVELKSDNSPLTQADKSSSKIISSYLSRTNIPIIDEEMKQLPFEQRKNWDRCWIVDPLDGTKEFVKRNGEFTVNIALVDNGKPVLGVIYVPVEKVLYYADVSGNRAMKAVLESHNSSMDDIINKSLEIKPSAPEQSLKVVGSRSHMNKETSDFISGLEARGKKVEIVSRGSSLKFCLVAEGSAHIYPRFAPTMEWDTAAGQALCNAVGVDVISTRTNNTLLYNKEDLLNPWFVVSQ